MTIIENVITNPLVKVYQDRSTEKLAKVAQLTSQFVEISNVIIIIDGNKFLFLVPNTNKLQNRDFIGWTKDLIRNIL